jgi:hypothetical protein
MMDWAATKREGLGFRAGRAATADEQEAGCLFLREFLLDEFNGSKEIE